MSLSYAALFFEIADQYLKLIKRLDSFKWKIDLVILFFI